MVSVLTRQGDEPIRKIRAMREDECLPPIETSALFILHSFQMERKAAALAANDTRQAGIKEDARHGKFAEHLDTITKMLADDATDLEIAKVININVNSVTAYLRKFGYRKK